ncbi:MAG: flagellar protein FlgN [Candidatus Nanopelagicales bacterium]
MDFAHLSRLLWRERDLLDTLLFKLHEQNLLLTAGDAEWLPRASREIEAVLERVGEIELERAVEFARASTALGLEADPSLRTLAEKAPEPWGYVLEEHHHAFVTLAARIQHSADANKELTVAASRATEAVLAGLDGAKESTTAYAATGQVQVDIRRPRPSLVDEAI